MTPAGPAMPVIALEEHVWIADLRDALLRWGGDDSVNVLSAQPDTDRRLQDVGDERLARMDAAGVDLQVLSITTPGVQPLPATEAVPVARDANDFLADAVRARPDRFAVFATLPTSDPHAAAEELERCITQLHMVGVMLFPRSGGSYLDDERFRPGFETAAHWQVPIYLHPAMPPRAVQEVSYHGFDAFTKLVLTTGGWGWHADAGLAVLRLIFAGTFDRDPGLQLVLGHWGEMVVPFADRADLLSVANPHLERRVLDYITGNLNVTAGGVFSHRMFRQALDVVGPQRIMIGTDDPYGAAGYTAVDNVREFLRDAALDDDAEVGVAAGNAKRLLRLPPRP